MPATRCPHCQTRFRVTPAQLELRAGLVRCGACREIFNGRDYLLQEPAEIEALASTADESDGRMTLIDFGSLRGSQPAVTPNSKAKGRTTNVVKPPMTKAVRTLFKAKTNTELPVRSVPNT